MAEGPRFGSVHDAARAVVVGKEQRDAAKLIEHLEIAKGLGAEGWKALENEAREEIARLNDNGKHDHEEAWVGTRVYTSGREGRKPKLFNLKGEDWVQKGE